ncbi:MAG: hypothetical protein RL071_2319 [Pseudomonadota bacterium]
MSLPADGPWDPEVIHRITTLSLRARQQVEGLRLGVHASRRVTSNVEFADYKEYSPGDPLRDLDWRVAARSDRLVVRRHRAEDELGCLVVLDASADLLTGKASAWPRGAARRPPLDGSKWGYAVVLAASLAWAMARRGEPVGLQVLGGADVRWPYLPLRAGEPQLARILGVLASARPDGRAELAAGLREVGARLRPRTLVVLISDLMEEPAAWAPVMAGFREHRVDLRVLHVHDPAEWRFAMDGPARYRSPEGGPALPADPADVAAGIAAVVEGYLREVRAAVVSARGLHLLAPSDADMVPLLGRLLAGRA